MFSDKPIMLLATSNMLVVLNNANINYFGFFQFKETNRECGCFERVGCRLLSN